MKKVVVVLVGLMIALFAIGCSDQNGKAPENPTIVKSDSGQLMGEFDKDSVKVDKDDEKVTITVYECLPTGSWHTATYQAFKDDKAHFRYRVGSGDWERINSTDASDPRVHILTEIIKTHNEKSNSGKDNKQATNESKMGWTKTSDGTVLAQNDSGKTVGKLQPNTIAVSAIGQGAIQIDVYQVIEETHRWKTVSYRWKDGDKFFMFREQGGKSWERVEMSARGDARVFLFAAACDIISKS